MRFFLLLACIFLISPFSFAGSQASEKAEELWKDFRSRFPFPIQTLAEAGPFEDGSTLLLIAEPPSQVKLEGLQGLCDSLGIPCEIFLRKHPIGADGWVADLLLIAQKVKEGQWDALKKQVLTYCFRYTDPSGILALDDLPASMVLNRLDLSIRPAEWLDWMDKEPFSPEAGGEGPWRIYYWLGDQKPGLYYSEQPGLVAWVVPREGLKGREEEGRRFFLETDLILGAVGTDRALAIVGRARQVPYWALPPLRMETVQLLAETPVQTLEQAFLTDHIFAGRLKEETYWAPAYLKPQLEHTELGMLMHFAGQQLAAGCFRGMLQFDGPSGPVPGSWPFDTLLPRLLGTQVIGLEWAGAGHSGSWSTEGRFWYASVQHTAALPVGIEPFYAPAAKARKAGWYAARAQEWFAAQSDPQLVRLTQYATLFQLFENFFLERNSPVVLRSRMQHFEPLVRDLLDEMLSRSDAEMEQRSSELVRRRMGQEGRVAPLAMETVVAEMSMQAAAELKAVVEVVRNRLAEIEQGHGEQGVARLIALLADPKLPASWRMPSLEEWEQIRYLDEVALELKPAVTLLAEAWSGPEELLRDFQAGLPPVDGWICTPSHIIYRWDSAVGPGIPSWKGSLVLETTYSHLGFIGDQNRELFERLDGRIFRTLLRDEDWQGLAEELPYSLLRKREEVIPLLPPRR